MRQALNRISHTSGRLAVAGTLLLAASGARTAAAVVFDLNGDGRSDIVLRNPTTGANRVIFMNGTQVVNDAPVQPLTDRDYVMAALADFNLDNKADLLWRHQSSGERFYWTMDGANVAGTTVLGQNVDTDWRVAGVGAMGGDARADVVWRHEATGEHVLWIMSATGPTVSVLPAETDLGWRIAGVGDANGDTRSDLYWRHRDGRNRIWLMGNGVFSQSINLPPRDPKWQFVGAADFDLNGSADILWRHPVSGKGIIWLMSSSTIIARSDELFVTHGGEWQPEMLADYNGDGKSDILWRHQSAGQMQVWLMDGENRIGQGNIPTPGAGFALAGKPQPPASASIYLATLTPEGAANTPATGSSTIVLSPDGLSAKITLNFTNLTTMQTAAHIHGPADPGTSAPALYSVPMGSFNDTSWIMEPTGGLTVADQVDALRTGRLYINVHSTNYPNGEIRGQYRITAAGGVEPPIPNPPPAGPPTAARAHRFLQQATMGATPALVAQVQSIGYDAFIEQQFAQAPSYYTAFVDAYSTNETNRLGGLRSKFFLNAVSGPDQLRQRVAWALSQMIVTSTAEVQDSRGMARYQDIFLRNAFGNYHSLLTEITLDPVMGAYLNMANNDKPNPATGRTANENFARELLQLFSIGLFQTWPSGALKLDQDNAPIPTYDQPVVEEMARVFTGFTFNTPGCTGFNCQANYLVPMKMVQANHDIGQKTILNNVVLPPGRTGWEDLGDTINTIYGHSNMGPFVSRHLIQHLVTSNPSKGYLARVSRVFDNDGTGVKGNLRAVVKAILLDVEARRDPDIDPNFGRPLEAALFITQYVRGMGATGQGYGLAERAATLEQQVFGAPTVFNYYQPDYQVPGTTILGPPLQIWTESNAVRRANLVSNFVYNTIGLPGYAPSGSTTVSFTTAMAPFIQSAGNPGGLVDLLANQLMPGRMSPNMRQVIVNAVTATPASDPTNRARTAVYLIMTSPAFNVNR